MRRERSQPIIPATEPQAAGRTTPRRGIPSNFGPTRRSLSIAILSLLGLFAFAFEASAQSGPSFPSTNVGSTSTPQLVTVNIQSPGSTVGSIEILTQGAPNLDYSATTGGTCATGSAYATSCTVNVSLTPHYPGIRSGAVVLLDVNGNPMGLQLLYGVGVGPLAVMTAGEITTAAGNGGYFIASGSNSSLAVNAVVRLPSGVAVDGAGNIYYTDADNLIGKVDPSGNLTIIAGSASGPGFSPDGTLAASAMLDGPSAILIDGAGNVYFTEISNNDVREIVKATGKIQTVAGNRTQGYSGEGVPATSATLNQPQGLAMDAAGNLYIADTGNSLIREVSAANGTISTIAGDVTSTVGGYGGDNGPATSASLNQPYGLAIAGGYVYIADLLNNRIRRIDPNGIITTVAGTGLGGYSGDTQSALSAALNQPYAVVVDPAGDLFISDSGNNVVRKVSATTQVITTIAGNGSPGSLGDGVDADNGIPEVDRPFGLVLDAGGDLFVADHLGLRVRELYGNVGRILFKDIKETNTSAPIIQKIDNDGNAPLLLNAITPTPSPTSNPSSNAAFDPATTTCSTTTPMAIAAECSVGVEFKPEMLGMPVTGSISITSNAANSPGIIDLSGNALDIDPSTTTVTSSLSPSAVGQQVTFTATVASAATNVLAGSVSFYDGIVSSGTLIGGAQILHANRQATVATSSLTLGSHTITAVFSDTDGSSTSSTSATLTQIVKQAPTLLLSSSALQAHVYDSITFTVTVTENPSGGIAPSGNIVFSLADGSQLGTGSITGGTATYTTSLLAAGSYQITASYAADANNLSATSNTITQVVSPAPTTTTLGTTNASAPLQSQVTFTAQVAGVSTSTPTGTVTFKDGNTTLGSAMINPATGIASYPTSTLSAGPHAITATYSGDTDYAASTSNPALPETILQLPTSATVVPSANPAIAGATLRFTVTVAAQSSTTPNIPVSGTISLMEGSKLLGTGMVAASGTGPATATVMVTVVGLGTGPHNLTVQYSGDTNYSGTSSPLTETINAAAANVALNANPASAVATKPVVLTATVTSNGGIPGGQVSFTEAGSTLGTGTLTNGIATISIKTLAVGTHNITANYLGDSNDGAASSPSVTVTINAATTSVALTPSQNPINFGQQLTVTATVTGNGGTPTGSVTFSDSASGTVQTVPLTAGVATFKSSTLADGTHPFTASYSGDASDSPSSSSTLNIQVLQTATLTLTSTSPNPSIARSNVHFVATITGLQGTAATGVITFKDGSLPLGSGTISGGSATFDTNSLAVGTHSIIAYYLSDGTTQSMNSAAYPQTINAAGTSVTISSSASPATFGTLLTFTATASSPAGPLTGTVKFEDNGTPIGSGELSSTGVATFSTSTLAAGSHNIVAAYQGDSNDQPASSSTLVQVVERTSSITLASSQNPLLTLAPVTITATVTNGGGITPTGTVTFLQDSVAVSTMPVTAGGTATLAVATLTAGAHSFTATYSGDAIDFPSTSTALSEAVQLRSTTDTLTTSASSLTGGQQLTLISVVRWSGSATPTGTVSFLNGTQTLATTPVDSTGVATVTVLLTGTSASVSSIYSGDASYATSTSSPDLVTIGPAPDFNFTADPPAFGLATTQHQMMTITISSLKNFTDTLSLGCLGLPLDATCTFSTDQFTLAPGGMQSVQLTVDTGNPLLAGAQAKNEAPKAIGSSTSKLIAACFLPGSLLLGLVGLRFRRLRSFGGILMLFLLLAGMSTALTGCGTINLTSTPPGVYNFAITATGKTGVSQSIPVTMTVMAAR